MHQPHQHQSSACAWPAPMPMDANPSAPATAAPAAIFFSFIVNSSISRLPRRYQVCGLPHTGGNGEALTTISGVYIVPLAAFVSHIDCAASLFGQPNKITIRGLPFYGERHGCHRTTTRASLLFDSSMKCSHLECLRLLIATLTPYSGSCGRRQAPGRRWSQT